MMVGLPDPNTPGSPDVPVNHCGIEFSSNSVRGKTVNGQSIDVSRSEITRYTVRAIKSRSRAIRKVVGSLVLFGGAGIAGLDAVGIVDLFSGSFLNSQGVQAALIIALLGAGARLFSTAWDPRHMLVLSKRDGEVGLVFSPSPEPFKLMEATDQVKERFGIEVELYPEL